MKIYRHILSWLLVIAALTLLFRKTFGRTTDAFYFVSMLLPIIAGTFYFLDRYLVPRYLLNEKYLKFGLYLFYTVVLSLYLEMVVMLITFIFFANFNLGRMEPYASDVIVLGFIMYMIVFGGLSVSTLVKLRYQNRQVSELGREIRLKERAYLEIRSNRMKMRIYHDEIQYIESLSDYIRFSLDDGKTATSREKISHVQERLPASFLRCHRSFIVNTGKIASFNTDTITVNTVEIPVSRSYRQNVKKVLSGKS